MSQLNVERVIGRLATDEAFRRRFAEERAAVLAELAAQGFELTACERVALASLDTRAVGRFADQLDPRIQKCDLTRRLFEAWPVGAARRGRKGNS
jgi:hypothetical protein